MTETSDHAGDRPPCVLVAEDQYGIALSMEILLEDLGYRVLGPAARLDEAIALIDEAAPDGAILDLNLHGQHIAPVARRLRELNVPFLVYTGYSSLRPEDGELADAPRLGKPARAEQIEQALQALLSAGPADRPPPHGRDDDA